MALFLIGKRFSLDLACCAVAGFFGWVLSRSFTTRWRVSPLCGIAHAKSTPNKWKHRSRFKTNNNTSKRKSLKRTDVRICSHMGPRNITNMTLFTLRFFVTATENGTFSTINISKTIAGATGGDRSNWKSNKQATRKCKNWTQKARKKETKHLLRNITPNTRETNAVRWSLKTQKKNQHLGQTHL